MIRYLASPSALPRWMVFAMAYVFPAWVLVVYSWPTVARIAGW